MKSRLNNSILKMMLLVLTSFFVVSCDKETEEPKTVVTVTTSSISQITQTSAKSGGTITITGNATIDGKGVCWSTTSNPTISLSTKTADGAGSSSFTSDITGLTANTSYFVRAYATYSEGVVYGNQVTFTTKTVVVPVAPTVNNLTVTNVKFSSVTLNGKVNANGFPTTSVKFEYGTTTSYGKNITLNNVSGTTLNDVTANLTDLTPNTTYHYRLVATNDGGTTTSSDMTFKTLEYEIGVECDGGIIAYIYQQGDAGYQQDSIKGLIVAKSDTISVKWGMSNLTILNLKDGLNEGKNNTDIIIEKQGQSQNYAALICRNKIGDGWFLPSIDELQKIFINKTPNMNFDTSSNISSIYWSSTQFDSNNAKLIEFKDGYSGTYSKTYTAKVRAVRYLKVKK